MVGSRHHCVRCLALLLLSSWKSLSEGNRGVWANRKRPGERTTLEAHRLHGVVLPSSRRIGALGNEVTAGGCHGASYFTRSLISRAGYKRIASPRPTFKARLVERSRQRVPN